MAKTEEEVEAGAEKTVSLMGSIDQNNVKDSHLTITRLYKE